MTVSEELTTMRARFPGCSVVAFADLSTGLVLASSTAGKTTHEKLDALCNLAHSQLLGANAIAVSSVCGTNSDRTPEWAWQAGKTDVKCFVKAPFPASEALCFEVSGDVSLVQLCDEATSLLSRIAAEG